MLIVTFLIYFLVKIISTEIIVKSLPPALQDEVNATTVSANLDVEKCNKKIVGPNY